MIKRKITNYLLEWKNKTNKVPLIIKGLRQIGKTFIVKDFAIKNYENAFILDFRQDISLHALFNGDFNIDVIAQYIALLPDKNQLIIGSRMIPNKTIIIFDELQDCPNARSSLKYFKEDGRFDIVCTGSLLGLDGYRISKKPSRGIAVGFEELIEMFPLDFEEFLWANKIDQSIIDLLKKCVDNKQEIPSFVHDKFLELIKKYICVGGMPEAVIEFIETNDLLKVRDVQTRLINNYKADFGIHLNDNGSLETNEFEKAKIMDVFNAIPRQLAKNNKKFQYTTIRNGAKSRTYSEPIKWLRNYGLIDICYNLSSIDQPLEFVAQSDQFKIYLADIGLLMAMLNKESAFNVLTNNLDFGKGMIYENLIADALHKLNKPHYYYSKSSGLEIDFISILFSKTYLIEVKAKSGNTKSSRTLLENPACHVSDLLKLTSQNIGFVDNKFTVPYYLSFYILNK